MAPATRSLFADDGPTVTQAYGRAWKVLTHYFVELVLLALAWIVLTSPAAIARRAGAPLFAGAYFTFVVVPLNFGALKAFLEAVRGRTPRVGYLLEPFRSAYLQVVLAHVLWVTFVGLGFALLIVPGFVVATRLAFVGFLVMDEGADAVDAMKESWRRTEGYAGTLFGIFLLAIPLGLLGALLFGVGVVPASLWAHLAFATVFADVSGPEQ